MTSEQKRKILMSALQLRTTVKIYGYIFVKTDQGVIGTSLVDDPLRSYVEGRWDNVSSFDEFPELKGV